MDDDVLFGKYLKNTDFILGIFLILLVAEELISYTALINSQKIAIQLLELLGNKVDTHVLLGQSRFYP